MMVALRSFTTTYEGQSVRINAGRDRARASHPIVVGNPDAFKVDPGWLERQARLKDLAEHTLVRTVRADACTSAFSNRSRREPDGRIAWTFVVDGDTSGTEGMDVRGATRRWEVVTDPTRPVVVHACFPPSRKPELPPIAPDHELKQSLRLHVHEELVRAELTQLVLPSTPPPAPAGRRRNHRKEPA